MRAFTQALALIAALLHPPTPAPRLVLTGPVAVGKVFYYERGVFALVARNRGMSLRADLTCYASTPDPARLGQIVRLRIEDGPVERCLVLDYSNPRDLPAQRRKGLVAEVNWATAQKYRLLRADGKAPVVVLGFEWGGMAR